MDIRLRKVRDIRLKDIRLRKVKDHCHYTGEYTSAAHHICNLKYRVAK